MQIIVDTNFFMLPGQYKIDVFQQLKDYGESIITFSSCVRELEKLAKKKGKNSENARIGMQLLEENRIEILTKKGSADKVIVEYAKKMKDFVIVATNDRALIKTLKRNGIKIIRLRQKKYLTVE